MTTAAATALPRRAGAAMPAVLVLAVLAGALAARSTSLVLLALAPVLLVWAVERPQDLLLAGPVVFLLLSTVEYPRTTLLYGGVVLGSWLLGLRLGHWRVSTGVHLLVAALAGWLVLSYALAQPPSYAAFPFSRRSDLLTLLLGLGLTAAAVSFAPRASRVLDATVLSAALASAVLVSGYGAQVVEGRTAAFHLNPNYLAVLLAMGLVGGVARLLATRRPLWLVPVALVYVGLMKVQSREALVDVGTGLLVLLLVGRSVRGRVVVLAAAALLTLTPLTGVVTSQLLGDRLQQNLAHGDSLRREAITLALQDTARQPVTGIGYGLFSAVTATQTSLDASVNTHDDYLRLAAEAGVPALALFAALTGTALVAPRRRRRHGVPDPERAGRQAVLATYAVALLFANTLSNLAVTAPFWLLLGTALSPVWRSRREGGG